MNELPKTRGWMVGAVVALIIVGGAVATISFMRNRDAVAPAETRAEAGAPSAPSAALPPDSTSALVGVWRGRIDQPSSRQDSYQLVADVSVAADDSIAARVTYPDLACSGVWTSAPGTARSGGPWRVRETIDRNPDRCIPVLIDLSRRADGGLNVLIKVSEDTGPLAVGAIYRETGAATSGGG